ncbi:hypothetical protein ACHAXR_003452 [Thalassiosira sp. AJA248-18]
MYCGDETGAFIGDVGSHTARFGYGGEDCPKVVVPSAVYSRSSSGSKNNNDTRGKYSAPVSLMRTPPDDCFSGGGESGDEIGFIPVYQSLNSNNRKNFPGGNNADDGLIQDIDAWASLWEYSYQSLCVRGKRKHTVGHKYEPEPELQPETAPPSSKSQTISSQSTTLDGPIDHPLLVADSTRRTLDAKTQEKQRSLMLETLFESLSAPAAYIAPSPMLSSFAYGRQTSLVIDVGHSGSRVTPLVDGHCLSSGSVSSGRGGRWLGNVQKSVLEGVWDVNESTVNKWNGWGNGNEESGVPPCQEDGVIPRYLLQPNLREKCSTKKLERLKLSSFHSMTTHEVMYEMMTSSHILSLASSDEESTPFCGYGSKDGEILDKDVDMAEVKKEDDGEDDDEGSSYELPDGTRVDLTKSQAGKDLCRLPELFFSETLPSFIQPQTNENQNMLPLQHLIHKSLTQILDVDLRKELSSNIILTGGASLFPTLDKRLSTELGEVLPSSYKYKVISSKNSVENRYSAWIGGSVLSSLGSFQQLWLSKREYEECGAVLGLQRFKN